MDEKNLSMKDQLDTLRNKFSQTIKLEEVFLNGFAKYDWELSVGSKKYTITICTASGDKIVTKADDVVSVIFDDGKPIRGEEKTKFLNRIPSEINAYILQIYARLSDVIFEKIGSVTTDFSQSQ